MDRPAPGAPLALNKELKSLMFCRKINRTYPAKPHLATVVAVETTTDSSHNGPLPSS
jgi:hypothetical protein